MRKKCKGKDWMVKNTYREKSSLFYFQCYYDFEIISKEKVYRAMANLYSQCLGGWCRTESSRLVGDLDQASLCNKLSPLPTAPQREVWYIFREREVCTRRPGTVLSRKQAGSVTQTTMEGLSFKSPDRSGSNHSQPFLKKLGRVHVKMRTTGSQEQAEPRPPRSAFIGEQCHLMSNGADIRGRLRTEPKVTWISCWTERQTWPWTKTLFSSDQEFLSV